MKTSLMIGGGAGFAGDRIDAAIAVVKDLSKHEGPRYIIFETLAERTLALSQSDTARADREQMMIRRLRAVLPVCMESGIRIIANFGSWSPDKTAQLVQSLSAELGCSVPRVAVVTGDDLLEAYDADDILSFPTDDVRVEGERLIAANAYMGAFPIAKALDSGADIVITGRVADPSLALGPMISVLGLSETDWDALACGTLAGHLIECGAQVCGGYFADPGFKDVPNLPWVGFPIVEISESLQCLVRKPEGTGGYVNRQTVIEQLLYEIHDPGEYLTPDVILDVSKVTVTDLGNDRVVVENMSGKPKPDTLKATLCFEAGWIGEAEISYAGLNAENRGRLAVDVIRTRAQTLYPDLPLRCDLIGVVSAFGSNGGIEGLGENFVLHDKADYTSSDVRIRVATIGQEKTDVQDFLGEIEALYTTGPAGGGGARLNITPRITTSSSLVPADRISSLVTLFDGEKSEESVYA